MDSEWVIFEGKKRRRRSGPGRRALLAVPLMPAAAVFVYWTIAMAIGLARYILRGGPDVRGDVVRDLPPGVYVVAGLLALVVAIALVSAVVLPFARRSHLMLWFYASVVAALACVVEIIHLVTTGTVLGWRAGYDLLSVYLAVVGAYLVVYAVVYVATARDARRRNRFRKSIEDGRWRS